MKNINTYVVEKLKISKNKKIEHTLFPETRDELITMIIVEIKQNGYECDLNHIDISKITDLDKIFWYSETMHFNGDISQWDVSNVTNMYAMFNKNKYFNQDISMWKIKPGCNTEYMFLDSCIKHDYRPFKNGKRIY